MAGNRASGLGQGPAKGPSAAKSTEHKPLNIETAKQRERGRKGAAVRWGSLKEKMRAYSQENPESKVTERAPNRLELAEMARSGMPDALKRLELLIHTSRSDVAVVQAFNALKEAAYGKDPQAIDMRVDFENMTDDELRSAIATEIAATDHASGGDAGGASQT